nr:hypothetical protein [Bacteroidota bacterium]
MTKKIEKRSSLSFPPNASQTMLFRRIRLPIFIGMAETEKSIPITLITYTIQKVVIYG